MPNSARRARRVGCNGSVVGAPPSELLIDERLVGSLLRAQCPDLAELPLAPLGNGWDNELFRLGDSMLVRLPRRAVSAPLMESEVRWLPTVASLLTVEVPLPVFVGHPSDAYPWTWTVVPFVSGPLASEVPVADRVTFADQLAEFFWSLHVPAPSTAPLNPVRGVSLSQERFDARARARIAADPRADALLERWSAWTSAPDFDGVDVWVHGDAHPHNFVRGPDARLRAVLDWGDLTAGDPASDLAAAWLTCDAPGREVFLEQADQGGLYDAATWTRAKAGALHLGLILSQHSDDQPTLAAIGRHALEQVLAEAV